MNRAIKEAARGIAPSDFMSHILFLKALYQHMKEATEGYSYKKFAADLGFPASTIMHQVVSGYRPLTLKAAERIVKALSLESKEQKYFLHLVAFAHAQSPARRQEIFEELLSLKRQTLAAEADKDALDYFSDWYNPVIWELIGTRGFRSDPAWIAQRITPKLKIEQVKASLELLLRLELISFDAASGTYRQTKARVSTGHRVKGLALVSFHQNMIDHGKSSLTRISGSRRDVSSVTVSVSEEGAQKLRSMIHAFQLQLMDEADKAGEGDQVYQINIQLFPFTE